MWILVWNDAAVPYWVLISERFDSLQFKNPVTPCATVSGFVLTSLDEPSKVVEVDLIARGDARSFTFVAVAAGN